MSQQRPRRREWISSDTFWAGILWLRSAEDFIRFTDKASGKDTKRPQLQAALEYLRDGDVLVVHSMDRLARNLDDLRRIVSDLTASGVVVEFLKERLTFTSAESPMNKLLLSVMGAFAEFERALLRERQREGIAIAKKKGVYRGRKPSLTPERVQELRSRVAGGRKRRRWPVNSTFRGRLCTATWLVRQSEANPRHRHPPLSADTSIGFDG